MKKLILHLLLIVWYLPLFAQTPNWAINLPKSKNPTMDYLVGIGEGSTEKEARNDAFNDVLRKLIVRFRLPVNSNDIMDAVYRGASLTTISKDYNLPPMREVCYSNKREYGKYRVYLLYQIAANSYISSPQFENFKCGTKSRNGKSYVAWAIAGGGFPWNVTSGISSRFGGAVGIGFYGDVGVDFTRITVAYSYAHYEDKYSGYDHVTRGTFRYAGGINFFPYNGLYLACGYGSIVKPFADVEYQGDPPSSMDGEYDDYKIAIRKKVPSPTHGLLLHIGYDIVSTERFNGNGHAFFLSINGGVSYDMTTKEYMPSVNLKIGCAWNTRK